MSIVSENRGQALPNGLTPSADACLSSSERKCLVTGAVKPKTEMIRFVLGPDRRVVPDLAERLPGRGMWISAEADAIKQAIKKNLFTHAAKNKADCPPDLYEQVLSLLARRCLEFVGLARGAGQAVVGQAQVEKEAKAHALSYILVAADAGQDGMKKLSFSDIPIVRGLNRAELGAALGHEHLVYVGLKNHPLTNKLKIELARLLGATTGAMTETEKKEV